MLRLQVFVCWAIKGHANISLLLLLFLLLCILGQYGGGGEGMKGDRMEHNFFPAKKQLAKQIKRSNNL